MSTELIESARRAEADVALGVPYRVAEVSNVSTWWDGEPFDGAVCEMAVMDIDDFPAAVRAVRDTVEPGGWFLISMVHPCFPGNEAGLSSWPPRGTYFDEGRWTSSEHNREGVRIRVGSSHRTFSTILNTLVDSGFTIERVVEPPAPVSIYLLIRSSRVLIEGHSEVPAQGGPGIFRIGHRGRADRARRGCHRPGPQLRAGDRGVDPRGVASR